MDSWGNPPSYFDPDDDVLAKHCVRSLHLPFRAWSDDQMATHLGSMLQRATSHQDSWVQFIAESLDAYPTTGCVQADGTQLEHIATNLSRALNGEGKNSVAASSLTLRKSIQQTSSADRAEGAHFTTRPSAVAALEEAFKPLEVDPPLTRPEAGGGARAAAKTATVNSGAPATAGSAAATSAAATAAIDGRGRGGASKGGGSGALISSRGTGRSSTAMAPPPRGGSAARSAASSSARPGAAAKKNKMMMMDSDEASKLMLASMAGPVKPLKEKKAPVAGAKASGTGKQKAGKVAPDPFAGAVVEQPNGLVHYFQDRRKKWTYHTDATGAALLKDMIALASPLIQTVLAQLPVDTIKQGDIIYAQKPNLGANGVTWSQDNYGHLGLQAEYLRLKSIQRFTEGWQAMQRAYNAGAFRHLMDSSTGAGQQPFRVASFGGGPGFEMVAVRSFCQRHLPCAQPQGTSLDLAIEWEPCAKALGFNFTEWNVNDGEGVLRASGFERIDLAVISYVLYHYMSNEHCAEWMARRLRAHDIGAIMIISRFEDLSSQIEAMERRGIRVIKLMRQPTFTREGKQANSDHRQLLFLPGDAPMLTPLGPTERLRTTFPNVPHEDGKDPRDRSYDELVAPGTPGTPGAGESDSAGAPGAAGDARALGGAKKPAADGANSHLLTPTAEASEPPASAPQTQASSSSAAAAPKVAIGWGYEPVPQEPAGPASMPTANATAHAEMPACVPEILHEPLQALDRAELDLAVAFFQQNPAVASGTKEIVLQTEMRPDPATGMEVAAAHVILRLDFDTWAWKRVKRKVK